MESAVQDRDYSLYRFLMTIKVTADNILLMKTNNFPSFFLFSELRLRTTSHRK